jgi:hypothetical protein
MTPERLLLAVATSALVIPLLVILAALLLGVGHPRA